ncbi:MAG: peptidylprolyl isomerase [Bacteroidales bacterium]|jgi:peptidyl-prolyl cis-trans isomerase D
MAIIGRIRKHSGLAVIIVGVAIAAFVVGDFGKKRMKSTNEVGSVNGEAIPYPEFSNKVEEAIQNQKDNSGSDKITDEETFSIRQNVWNTEVKDILMQEEYDELGIAVSPDELFDQVQGKNPHRFILQYFKDPKTNAYDPALVRNYLKNLDNMEPKNKEQWLRFEKAIKDDRIEAKFDNLIKKGYYMPNAFLKKMYEEDNTVLSVRAISPALTSIPDNNVVLTDADYQAFYNKNKEMFFQEEPSRELNYVLFEVKPSDADRKKIADDVTQLYKDFSVNTDLPNFINANGDKKFDSTYKKKGNLPGMIDSTAFSSKSGTLYPPFELDNAWYMAKILDIQDRPDSMKGSTIVVSFAGSPLKDETIKRTREQAKSLADSLLTILKKSPDKFREFALKYSNYPTVKDDGGDLKDLIDGQPSYSIFFTNGLKMKPKEMKMLETSIGYAIFRLNSKTKPIEKVKVAILQRNIEPSNQTFQETYLKASAFAGQNRTKEAFTKASAQEGIPDRTAENVHQMDNSLNGLSPVREVVRWAYSNNTQIGDISPVFDLTGKYVVAILTGTTDKGYVPLEKIKDRITQNVRNEKKIDMLNDKLRNILQTTKDLNQISIQLKSKIDTARLTFGGYNNSVIGRDPEIVGKIFSVKTVELFGPIKGKYGAYVAIIDHITNPPAKTDFFGERMQALGNFETRASGMIYEAIRKAGKIKDNRENFF